jgi:tetratricopeptide (TPR) repeat protein
MISVFRVFRLSIRFATWVTPHVKEWHRKRHLNRLEGERNLQVRNWSEAEKHFTAALSERKHSSKVRLGLLTGLEKAQRAQGKLAEAEQTARAGSEIAAKSYNHELRVQHLDALVDVLLEQKKYAEAEGAAAEIERLEKTQPYPNHSRLAISSRKLGTALLQEGRTAEAMEAFQKSLALAERAFGSEHLETAKSVAELGMLHRTHENHAEAQTHLRRALQIHRTVLGVDSPEATDDLHNLAGSLEESGDLAGAMGEYERLLALKERQVGGDREKTAETQLRLALLHMDSGNSSRARDLLAQSTGVLERHGGPRFILALDTMAAIEEQVGHWEAAKRLRDRIAKLAPQPAAATDTVASV